MSIKTAIGEAVGKDDTHWIVECPNCEKSYEYEGYYDPDDKTICERCGITFITIRVEFENGSYMGMKPRNNEI